MRVKFVLTKLAEERDAQALWRARAAERFRRKLK